MEPKRNKIKIEITSQIAQRGALIRVRDPEGDSTYEQRIEREIVRQTKYIFPEIMIETVIKGVRAILEHKIEQNPKMYQLPETFPEEEPPAYVEARDPETGERINLDVVKGVAEADDGKFHPILKDVVSYDD